MAKKARQAQAEPNPSAVPNRDVLSRLNFMYQAAALLSAVVPAKANARTRQPSKRKSSSRALIGTQPESLQSTEPMAIDGPQHPLEPGETEHAPRPDRSAHEPVASTSKLPQAEIPIELMGKRRAAKRRREACGYSSASRVLVKNMAEVAKKATLRMDPTVKRTFCRTCHQVLIAGLTSRVRVKPSGPHAHAIVHSCLTCDHARRLPAPPHLPAPVVDPPVPPQPHPAGEEPRQEQTAQMRDDDAAGREDAYSTTRQATRWEAKQRRRARQAVFFERAGHVTFVGTEQIRRDS